MFRTFNCGVGMVLCLPKAQLTMAIDALANFDLPAWEIGEVVPGAEGITFSE